MRLKHPARLVGLALLLLFAAGVAVSEAADYRARKNVDGFTFEITINRNPPVLGKNDIRIEIRDPQGNPVPGSEVTVNYYMPPMPRMPPMNYTVTAAPEGAAYRAVMDLIMSGPWNIIVRANTAGKPVRATFPIDVR
jgi:hypothetical protein